MNTEVNKRLVRAVKSVNASAVIRELENGANVNMCIPRHGYKSVPLLVLAARDPHDDVVAALLGGKPDVEAQGDYRRAPLSTAVKNGHTSIATKLLDYGADIHKKDIRFGNTSVHWAAGRGVIKLIEVLYERGGSLEDVATLDGKAPIHLAAQFGCMNMVRWLYHLKVNIAAFDMNGETPAELAENAGHMALATWLRSLMAQQQSLVDCEKCEISLYIRPTQNTGISKSFITHWALMFSWPGDVKYCFEGFEKDGILTPEYYEGDVDPNFRSWSHNGQYTARDCFYREVITYAMQQGGNDYHIVRNNCQTFARDLAKQFNVNLPISGSERVNKLTSQSFHQQ